AAEMEEQYHLLFGCKGIPMHYCKRNSRRNLMGHSIKCLFKLINEFILKNWLEKQPFMTQYPTLYQIFLRY
ncbi:hypothetical protein ACJX0J_035355, partial [Zea mays]